MVDPSVRLNYVLWFFSTCSQTFAALVGVFAVFTIFRLQIEEGRIGALRERMTHYHPDHQKLPFNSILQAMKKIGDAHLERDEVEHSESINILLKNYAGALEKRSWLGRSARWPILILIVLTLWSLAALIIFPDFDTSWTITRLLLWGTLASACIPFYQVGVIVFHSLRVD